MEWFSVHEIVYFKFKGRTKGPIPVWENIVLVRARDEASAARIAEKQSRKLVEALHSDTLEMDGRPGTLAYAGVRKVLPAYRRPGSGDEVSFVEMTVPDEKAVRALAAGKKVEVTCDAVLGDRPRAARRRKRVRS